MAVAVSVVVGGRARVERGSVVPLVAGVVGVGLIVCVGVGHVAQAMIERARAQAAADAAALAGVVEGEVGAADLARRNGAELHQFRGDGGVVTVVVERGGARATAAAVYDQSAAG